MYCSLSPISPGIMKTWRSEVTLAIRLFSFFLSLAFLFLSHSRVAGLHDNGPWDQRIVYLRKPVVRKTKITCGSVGLENVARKPKLQYADSCVLEARRKLESNRISKTPEKPARTQQYANNMHIVCAEEE